MNVFLARTGRAVRRALGLGVSLLAAAAVAQAPVGGVCTAMVHDALQAANAACAGTGRNQVCYGNILGQAIPADGVTDLRFDTVGDVAPVHQIKALSLSPLDETANQWGVALMQLQANLPDTLPGQNVTFLLFGDVAVEDAVGDQARVSAVSLRAANVRQRPSLNAEVLGAVPLGTSVEATGKHVNGAGEVWLRIKFDGHRLRTGWAYGNLFDIAFDLLPDVAPDSLVLNPMQAFYFRTGIGRATCAEAPTSGVVVQTPEGAGLVNFSVNGVNVTLGSTAVISGDSQHISIALLEGTGIVEHGGVTRRLVPGSQSTIAVEAGSGPTTPAIPTMPEPIRREKFAIIEDVLTLAPREVDVPEPATDIAIIGANPIGGPGGIIRIDIQTPTCPPNSDPAQCACNDVDGDGRCDAVPCSDKYPTMCIPGCRDADGDGKCDVQCFDRDADGRCDEPNTGGCETANSNAGCPPCTPNAGGACCRDDNHDGQCDAPPCASSAQGCGDCVDADNDGVCDPAPPVSCFVAGPVVCDPGCTNRDGDDMCDDYDDCIDADGDGTCDCSDNANSGCGTPTETPAPKPGIAQPTPTATPTARPNIS